MLRCEAGRGQGVGYKGGRVPIDYHIEFAGHDCAVPPPHRREAMVRCTDKTVEVPHAGQRAASQLTMLNHPTLEKHQPLKCHGMARAFSGQLEIAETAETAETAELNVEERFALMAGRECTGRRDRQLTNRRDLLEVIAERHQRRATIATSQLPVDKEHDYIAYPALAHPALAGASLDRLVHNAYTFKLKGQSMRKYSAKLTRAEHTGS